jgi:hypothetical protein
MKRDYSACLERISNTIVGITPDRVPLIYLTSEDISARIAGISIREMLSTPELLADMLPPA